MQEKAKSAPRIISVKQLQIEEKPFPSRQDFEFIETFPQESPSSAQSVGGQGIIARIRRLFKF